MTRGPPRASGGRAARGWAGPGVFIPPSSPNPRRAVSGIIDMVQDDTANMLEARRTDRKPPVVAIVVYDGLALFELAAANDVFGTDVTTASGEPLYRVLICGAAASVMTEAGFRMEVPRGRDA